MSQTNLIEQVANERKKKKREAVKGRLGKLFDDHVKAREVLDGIQAQIVEEIESCGESAEGIAEILNG